MKKVVIAGGSGFLGKALMNYFSASEYQFVVLSRTQQQFAQSNCSSIIWNGKSNGEWCKALEGADALINLTGKSVNCRYTEANKKEILASRIDATKALGEAILKCENPPKVWLNASSATIYRYSETTDMDETITDFNDDFSVSVCLAWEKCFNEFIIPKTRKITLRISLVMSRNDGVFPRLKNLVKFGLGGKQASGRQMVSWIHELDFCRAVEYFIENNQANGAYNLCSPNPISNENLMCLIRKKMKMPIGLPAYEWMLKLGAWLIGTETELIVKSRRVIPKRLYEEGLKLKFEKFENALDEMLSEK